MLRRILMMMVLALGVGTVANAERKYAALTTENVTTSENATWDSETKTFTWTAANAFIEFTDLAGDLSAYETLVLEFTALSPSCQVYFELEDGTTVQGSVNGFYSPSNKTIFLKEISNGYDFSNVKAVRLVGWGEDGGSLTLSYAVLIKPIELVYDESGKAYIYPKDFINGLQGATMTEDGVITKTGTSNASITIDLGEADLSGTVSIVTDVTTDGEYTDLGSIAYISIKGVNDNERVNTWYGSRYNIPYDDKYRAKSGCIAKMVYELDPAKEGQMKINSICITSGFITAVKGDEICLNDLPYYVKQSDENFVAQANTVWNMNIDTDIIYGDCNNVQQCKTYADVSEYKEVRLYSISGGSNLRFFFFNSDNTNIETIYAQAVEGKDYLAVNIDEVKEKCGGKAYLIGCKTSTGNANVTNIAVAKYSADADYNISGYGIVDASVDEILKDAAATRIDVTGLENANPMPLTSANPNCLFIASDAAKLANTTNVLVANAEGGYTCADLSLDAAHPFKAPFDFAATTATVKKSVSEIGFATFVSPYNVAVPDGCEAYKIVSVDADNALQCEPVTQIVANEPVLLVGEGAYEFAASDVTVSVAPETLVSGLLNGSYEATTAPVGSYVLQPQDGVTAFYRVAEAGKQQVVPFTAYLTLPAVGANVRMLSIDLGSDATAIENVPSSAATVVAVYDLSGRSVEGLQRGINLVKMSDGTVKKIIVK